MKLALLIVAAAAGVVSALLWGWSALVPIPSDPIIFRAHMGAGGANEQVEALMKALRRQSTLNKWAAVSAAVAIAVQTTSGVLFP